MDRSVEEAEMEDKIQRERNRAERLRGDRNDGGVAQN